MGNIFGQPMSASLTFGDYKTDPHNTKFLQQDYNQEGSYLTQNWVSGRWNPFLAAVGNELGELQESVAYNYRSLVATGVGLIGALVMMLYYAVSYLRMRWRKRKGATAVPGIGGDLNLHLPMLEGLNPGGQGPVRVNMPGPN